MARAEDDTELQTVSGPYRPAPSWVVESWRRAMDRRSKQGPAPTDA